ncbi:MAG: hypothetical protein PUF12_02485 [Thermoflexaceae bacterium]|nr:hypothetical protein [Thermoflexaceae bacterium]
MKIGEAQQLYRAQVQTYQMQKSTLSQKLHDVRNQMKSKPEEKETFGEEAAVLELTINALNEKQTEYQDYLSKLAEEHCAWWNMAVAEQQGDALEEYAKDLGKMMEVARRIMKGGIVPASDEKKLMEFSMELYQAAKNIGAMVQNQKKEEYDTLWGEEEEKEYEDPEEVAANANASSEGPEIINATEIVEAVGLASESASAE